MESADNPILMKGGTIKFKIVELDTPTTGYKEIRCYNNVI